MPKRKAEASDFLAASQAPENQAKKATKIRRETGRSTQRGGGKGIKGTDGRKSISSERGLRGRGWAKAERESKRDNEAGGTTPGVDMPSTYTAQQKTAISEFTGITQADKSSAAKLLKQFHWDVRSAVNAYFNNPATSNLNPTRKSLSTIFDSYRDDPRNEPDLIDVEGTGKLLNNIGIELDDVGALVFSELVQSPTLGKITREGFVDGLSAASVDTLPKIRNLTLQHRSALPTDPHIFKNVYNHTFTLGLAQGAKTLPLEAAIEFWRVLFTTPSFAWATASTPWLDWWLEYVEAKKIKAVNKDLWKQTLNFALETIRDESLGFWNEESSWPSVMDEFVAWVRAEKRGRGDAMDVA
ncbi:hypothetical protein LTR62_000165 [Meristemomyces frigidus]|uniref:Defective in cullin neddylation protein n=1 Tax=Meristemomyces frigidus TaxID=1508187 RepID=A0AAN7TS51_9PEZI|nr:hypothetical protein LTR62_000165 [Meristemomyces frigidus]